MRLKILFLLYISTLCTSFTPYVHFSRVKIDPRVNPLHSPYNIGWDHSECKLTNINPTKNIIMSSQHQNIVKNDKKSKFPLLRTFLRPVTYIRNKITNMAKKIDTEAPMLKYLWPKDSPILKLYLILSVISLFVGKWFTLQVPFAFQRAIDLLASPATSTPAIIGSNTNKLLLFSQMKNIFEHLGLNQLGLAAVVAVITYGFSRGLATAFAELKTCLFTNVSQRVCRKFALEIFEKMHSLGDHHISHNIDMVRMIPNNVIYIYVVHDINTL